MLQKSFHVNIADEFLHLCLIIVVDSPHTDGETRLHSYMYLLTPEKQLLPDGFHVTSTGCRRQAPLHMQPRYSSRQSSGRPPGLASRYLH